MKKIILILTVLAISIALIMSVENAYMKLTEKQQKLSEKLDIVIAGNKEISDKLNQPFIIDN